MQCIDHRRYMDIEATKLFYALLNDHDFDELRNKQNHKALTNALTNIAHSKAASLYEFFRCRLSLAYR